MVSCCVSGSRYVVQGVGSSHDVRGDSIGLLFSSFMSLGCFGDWVDEFTRVRYDFPGRKAITQYIHMSSELQV